MKPYAIGIDVGGTTIRAGVVDRGGRIVSRHITRKHSQQRPEVVLDAIVGAYRQVMEQSGLGSEEIEAVGLGFAGTVNGPAGIVLVSSNLSAWDHFPLRDAVAERVGLPVVLENDTNLGAVGEHRFGAGRGTRNMCYVTLSTGFGLGIIIDNKLYSGYSGTAGEIAHMVVEVGGPPCTCKKNGCLMAYASGVGLSRMAFERIRAGEETILRDVAPEDGTRISGEMLAAAAEQGDRVAQEVIQRFAYYCGVGLSVINQVLNPELIVVGGGLTHLGERLRGPMMAAMREHTQPELWEYVNIVPWELGDDLGILGGAGKIFADAEGRE